MKPTDPDVYPIQKTSQLPASPAVVIAALTPLVTDERLERIRNVVNERTRRIVPVLDALIPQYHKIYNEIRGIEKGEIGGINREIEHLRL